MEKSRLVISAFIAFFILISSVSYSQDWPQFRGINRDCRIEGFKVPATWPSDIKPEWKVTVGSGDASPVLSGNSIYLHTRQGDQEVVLCLDAKSGNEIWKDQYPCPAVTGAAASHPGPRSTPVISDGKVITLGVTAILSCYDSGTGQLLWRKDNPDGTVPQFFTGMSPIVVDKLCIIHIGTKDNGVILALDINTGKVVWKWTGEGPAYGSPSVMKTNSKRDLVFITEKGLLAINLANGEMVWQIATPLQQRYFNSVSPCIDGNIIYYTGQGTGTKAVRVDKSGSNYTTTELWSNTDVGTKWNTPVLKNGYIYGFSDQKRIFCLNASNGQTAWVDNVVNSDFSTLVDCGSLFIGLTSTGNLIVFKPESKAYTEVARLKVAETTIYAFPVIKGDLVYIKDAESLMLYRLK
jgi:outer membrane protein assembly factor BamB